MSKIIITHTIHKDGEYPICFRCLKPALGTQIKCNCGCDETYCQPCYYIHYRDFASKMTLLRFTEGDIDVTEEFSNAIGGPEVPLN